MLVIVPLTDPTVAPVRRAYTVAEVVDCGRISDDVKVLLSELTATPVGAVTVKPAGRLVAVNT
jgi:hypothetical protein